MLTDTHCHLTSPELLPQADAVLARARAAGVGRLVLVATDPRDAEAALALLRRDRQLYLVAGIHPHQAGRATSEDFAAIEQLVSERAAGDVADRVVGVGETGLDFHYDFAPRDVQERVFRAHLELACRRGRPVVIHARESELRVCEILADYPALRERVVFHCFSADRSVARRVLDLGDYLSFTGVVTFRNADAIRDAARFVPLERIMVETDAPYLSPEPMRKVRPNEPALVVHTARFLADIRGEAFDVFAAATSANAARFFSLSEVSP